MKLMRLGERGNEKPAVWVSEKAAADVSSIVRDFDPEITVVFGPDHFNGVFYDMMPASGLDNFRKIVAGKQLWNYDNLEPSEKKLVL